MWNLEMEPVGIVQYKIKLSTEKYDYTLKCFFSFLWFFENMLFQ